MTTVFNLDLGIKSENTYSINNKSLKLDTLQDIQPILDDLDKFEILEKLDISGNTISSIASKHLVEKLIKFQKTLIDLNLQDIYTSRDRFEIPKSLNEFNTLIKNCDNLKILNLSDNAFGQDSIDVLEDVILNCKSVEHLILSNNGLGPFSGTRIGKSLYKLSITKKNSNQSSLKTFWCGRNRLENGSIDYLSIGLKSNSDLQEIKLYQNGIRPSGISKLINFGIGKLSNLKSLDLQDNTFTLLGSVALSNNLKNWNHLIELNINDCLLKSKGCLIFLNKLGEISNISNLEILKLQYNELDTESLKLLSNILPNLKNLKSLELNGNRFEEDSEFIEKINEIFESKGFGELDELDDLEEPDSDEEEEEDDDDEDEEEEEDVEQGEDDDALKSLEEELSKTII
ncbi:hypothetical protein CANARDRAFT_238342 [[Candida] arabinofermentans NRRL YB-2248]|uniref:RNI-like protein n=1 Tax=[Candida] arabinofermentans NRRL YB-2248 TaxID=983967 RepID=A0A1E4SUT1_9ASCO|nr:hypothetical protein CANARDRAFT_238342 [[Candida] arabinofermentans NRRL YB-2248]